MSDSNRLSSVLWDKLLAEQRQSLVRTFGEMALRQVRRTPIPEEVADDERVCIGTPRHAA